MCDAFALRVCRRFDVELSQGACAPTLSPSFSVLVVPETQHTGTHGSGTCLPWLGALCTTIDKTKIIEYGKDLWKSCSPKPFAKAGSLKQDT